ncbi:hypothetical protein [uncultured Campylobacter sp.]|uniref:hypothetical protein n=1 Tax=uncultured Campylobacter sp. TaxID=218934 RepID=UPI0025ED47C9|nr:hypothetical protein [uncultured Campylobacter sp.]
MAEALIQILIVIFSVLLLGETTWTLFCRNPRKLSPSCLAAIDGISEASAVKRLSMRPFLFWLERFFISCESLWFDQDFIYVFDGQKLAARYKFEQILTLEATKIRINHARIWRIRFAGGASKLERGSTNKPEQDGASEYKFVPAASIFTPSFKEFLQILREKNRGAIKTESRFWETV